MSMRLSVCQRVSLFMILFRSWWWCCMSVRRFFRQKHWQRGHNGIFIIVAYYWIDIALICDIYPQTQIQNTYVKQNLGSIWTQRQIARSASCMQKYNTCQILRGKLTPDLHLSVELLSFTIVDIFRFFVSFLQNLSAVLPRYKDSYFFFQQWVKQRKLTRVCN